MCVCDMAFIVLGHIVESYCFQIATVFYICVQSSYKAQGTYRKPLGVTDTIYLLPHLHWNLIGGHHRCPKNILLFKRQF